MSSQPQPAQVEKDEEATLAFDVGRLPALLAALGFSLFVWAFTGDGYPFISALVIVAGFGAVTGHGSTPAREARLVRSRSTLSWHLR